MRNLVFIIGDFCSGNIIVQTIDDINPFRRGEFGSWGRSELRDGAGHLRRQERRLVVKNARPPAGRIGPPGADELDRYGSNLIGTAFGRDEKVVRQFSLTSVRLGWLRAGCPEAKIVLAHRVKDAQRDCAGPRGQDYLGTEDVGRVASPWRRAQNPTDRAWRRCANSRAQLKRRGLAKPC